MKKSKIILSLMLGGTLIFGGINANALTTENGNEIVTDYEWRNLDLTKYGFKECNDGIYYRYDNVYKVLILLEPKIPVDKNNDAITVNLKKCDDFKDKQIDMLYIDGCINFEDSFNDVVKNNNNMEISVSHYLETRENFKNKYGKRPNFNMVSKKFYFLDFNSLERRMDYKGLLGDYSNIVDNVVGYRGCRINNRILLESNNKISKVEATNTPATSTINNTIKEKYLVIDKEPTFEVVGESHIEKVMSNGQTIIEEKQEIPKLDESLKDVYYANVKEESKATETVQDIDKVSTPTPISTSTIENATNTATTTIQDNAKKDTADTKGILAILALGLGSLVSVMKFKKEK